MRGKNCKLHLFNEYLLSIYYAPDAVVGIGNVSGAYMLVVEEAR